MTRFLTCLAGSLLLCASALAAPPRAHQPQHGSGQQGGQGSGQNNGAGSSGTVTPGWDVKQHPKV